MNRFEKSVKSELGKLFRWDNSQDWWKQLEAAHDTKGYKAIRIAISRTLRSMNGQGKINPQLKNHSLLAHRIKSDLRIFSRLERLLAVSPHTKRKDKGYWWSFLGLDEESKMEALRAEVRGIKRKYLLKSLEQEDAIAYEVFRRIVMLERVNVPH